MRGIVESTFLCRNQTVFKRSHVAFYSASAVQFFGVPRSKCGAGGCGETQQVVDKMRCDGRRTPGEQNRGRCVWQEVSKHTKLRDMRNDERQQRTESLHMGSQL